MTKLFFVEQIISTIGLFFNRNIKYKRKTIQNGEIIEFFDVDYHPKEKFIDIFGILDT